MKVFVTGGTGLIGNALIRALALRSDEVVCLTRNATRARAALPPGVECLEGDPTAGGPWQERAADADAIVNLAGESIGGLWTTRHKRRVRRSRLEATRNVVAAANGSERVRLLVNASAVGYYGGAADRALDETNEPGRDFMARLCLEWEACAREAESRARRVVLLRTAPVLAREGGILRRLALPFRLFVGGPLGSGRQYFPWVHLEDDVRAILTVIDTPDFNGPVNIAVPNPPRQREFAHALAHALGRPCGPAVPGFVLRFVLGELAESVLASQRVVPRALRARGFSFAHENLDAALAGLLGRP